MDALTAVFTVCAVVGGLLFVIRLLLQFMGGSHDFVHDLSGGHDASHSDTSFKALSFQAIAAFLTMFGLAGRALLLDSRAGPGAAVLGASAAGVLVVWIIGRIFKGARRLQSSGNLQIEDAIGAAGEVYLNIPASGSGQVQVKYRNHQMVHDASSETGEPLPTGTPVKVTGVRGNALVVRRS